jgi:hypothetical protein
MNPNVINVRRVPGRLCFNTTDLSIAYPHGGTGLGVIKELKVKPSKSYYPIKAEELGNEIVDYIDGGESWIIGCLLRSFDKDAILKLFPSAEIGSQTQEALIKHPAVNTAIRAGNLASTRGIKLLFSPDDTIRQPFVIFYNAIPLVDETAEMNLEVEIDWTIGMIFSGIRDSAGKVMAMGFKGDFSL